MILLQSVNVKSPILLALKRDWNSDWGGLIITWYIIVYEETINLSIFIQ